MFRSPVSRRRRSDRSLRRKLRFFHYYWIYLHPRISSFFFFYFGPFIVWIIFQSLCVARLPQRLRQRCWEGTSASWLPGSSQNSCHSSRTLFDSPHPHPTLVRWWLNGRGAHTLSWGVIMDIFFLPLLLLWRNLDTHFLADLTDPSFCTYGMRTPVVFRSQHKCSVISFFFSFLI